jgi:hypothetical protein
MDSEVCKIRPAVPGPQTAVVVTFIRVLDSIFRVTEELAALR